jgi:hypothetical protein
MLALIVVQHHSLFNSLHARLATVVDSDTLRAAPEQRAALELGGADLVAFDGDMPERLAVQFERLLTERRR